mmetsp:Transcript_8459/g.17940  ORF Transcript_8459/g.17940 Transcript_8459/m.17940 type:complete len:251 (-) Transcript_8459:71-823(-)
MIGPNAHDDILCLPSNVERGRIYHGVVAAVDEGHLVRPRVQGDDGIVAQVLHTLDQRHLRLRLRLRILIGLGDVHNLDTARLCTAVSIHDRYLRALQLREGMGVEGQVQGVQALAMGNQQQRLARLWQPCGKEGAHAELPCLELELVPLLQRHLELSALLVLDRGVRRKPECGPDPGHIQRLLVGESVADHERLLYQRRIMLEADVPAADLRRQRLVLDLAPHCRGTWQARNHKEAEGGTEDVACHNHGN